MQIFYVLYISDEQVRLCIDAIRLFADPSTRDHAHVTVRGPYKRHHESKLKAWNEKIRNSVVRVYAVGSFFGDHQNTVLFKCLVPELRDVWKKPDYAGFNPHMTLYDGRSRQWAKEILHVLGQYQFEFTFLAEALTTYVSGRRSSTFDLRWSLDLRLLSKFIGPVEITSIDVMNEEERLDYISRIGRYLSRLEGISRGWNWRIRNQSQHSWF